MDVHVGTYHYCTCVGVSPRKFPLLVPAVILLFDQQYLVLVVYHETSATCGQMDKGDVVLGSSFLHSNQWSKVTSVYFSYL